MENEQPHRSLNLAQLFRLPFQAIVEELHTRLALIGYADIRPSQTIIFALVGTDGIRLSELAERAQLTKQLVTYLVNAVEERGYVERVPDPVDGRAKIVRLTERGRVAASEGRKIIESIEREWTERLGEARMHDLRATLEVLIGSGIAV